MRVLFIGKRFYTNRDAFREKYGRIWQLPWHWAEAGVPTRLWLVDYHTGESVETRDGSLKILSTPVRNLSVFRRYWSESTLSHRPEVIVASGDCYIGLMAYRLARRLGARFVFDVYDKYDEFGAYVRLPGLDPFRFLVDRADANLFASRALKERFGRASRDLLVQNGIDTRYFHPLDMGASRASLDLPQDLKLIGYFGSLDEGRGIDDLLEAQKLLRASGYELDLLIAGRARAGLCLDLPGVRYLGNLPYEKVPCALACCDLLAIPYRRSTYLDAASSCKIAEYIAMRRPVVATSTPNLVENFPDQALQLSGMLAEPGNPADLARAIQEQYLARRLTTLPAEMEWSAIASSSLCSLRLAARSG